MNLLNDTAACALIAPDRNVDPLHRVPLDVRPYYRAEIAEAVDGTVCQLDAALCFLQRGYDDETVRQAMIRAKDLFKRGIERMNELHAENKRRAVAATRVTP